MIERHVAQKLFSIKLTGLKTGEYDYKFQIVRSLFEQFGNEDIKNADVEAKILLQIKPNVTEVAITLKGNVTLKCDRCLKEYQQPLEIKEKAIVKQFSKNQDNEINIIIFDPEKGEIVLDQYFYDMIITDLPIQKVHIHKEHCDQDMIKRIEERKKKSGDTDPRWDDLKNLI